jgi:hypothetical protein
MCTFTKTLSGIGLVYSGSLLYRYVVWIYISCALCVPAPLCIYAYIITSEQQNGNKKVITNRLVKQGIIAQGHLTKHEGSIVQYAVDG